MPEEGMRRRPQAPSSFQKHQGRDIPRQSQSTLKRCQGPTWLRSRGSPKGFPQCGVLCCSQNAAEVAERGPEGSPATAALALVASKSSAIRCNSQKVGKWWMNILALPPRRLGKQVSCALCPGFATLVSDLGSPLPNITHGTHSLLPGGQLGQGGRLRGPFLQGDPPISPTSTAQTALIHKSSSSLGWLHALSTSVALVRRHLAAFLDIPRMMSTTFSPASIQPSWESLRTTQPSCWPDLPGSLGKGSYCFSSQTMGAGGSSQLASRVGLQVPQLVSPCHLSAQPHAGGSVIYRGRLPCAPCWERPRSHPAPPGEKGSCWVQQAMREPMGRGSQDHQCFQNRGCNGGTLARACATDERSSPAA